MRPSKPKGFTILSSLKENDNRYSYKITFKKYIILLLFALLVFWLLTLILAYLLIFTIQAEQLLIGLIAFLPPALLFLVLSLGTIYSISYSGKAYINQRGFGMKNHFAHYFLEWDKIEYLNESGTFTTVGNKNSHFSIPSFLYWGGREKSRFFAQLELEVDKRKIKWQKIKPSLKSLFKNCEIFRDKIDD